MVMVLLHRVLTEEEQRMVEQDVVRISKKERQNQLRRLSMLLDTIQAHNALLLGQPKTLQNTSSVQEKSISEAANPMEAVSEAIACTSSEIEHEINRIFDANKDDIVQRIQSAQNMSSQLTGYTLNELDVSKEEVCISPCCNRRCYHFMLFSFSDVLLCPFCPTQSILQ